VIDSARSLALAGLLFLPALAAADSLKDALDVARWLQAQGRSTDGGRVWPADPQKPGETPLNLYSGSSGVVLFFLELHRITGEKAFLEEAREGADYLLATLPEAFESEGPGLYTGIAGVGFVLGEAHRATGDEKYLGGLLETVDLLMGAAYTNGKGAEWNEVSDVISGSAGIGLFLLDVEQEIGLEAALTLAVRAGDRLVERAIAAETGSKWAMSPDVPRLMPNFSHGTAGVAYFLATLYQRTGEKRFLDAALEGGEYLKSIADVADDRCLIFHHEPDGRELHYLSWCHGPPGTARLFYRLFEITKDPDWMKWVEMSARGTIDSGIPEKRTSGFWNNVSQCCGSAGVAEFFLSLHQITRKPEYLAFARRMNDDALARATRDESGLRFPQAENRTQPDFIQAQTGFMQGAAGIGLWLLRLHAFEKGERFLTFLPDTPFRP
jgi:lantibiotic modifying enzyme